MYINPVVVIVTETCVFSRISAVWSPRRVSKSRPGLLRTKVYSASASSIPRGSVNEYQLRLGRQRQVWLIPLADETQGVHCAGKTLSSLQCVLYLSALETLRVEALYKSTTFTVIAADNSWTLDIRLAEIPRDGVPEASASARGRLEGVYTVLPRSWLGLVFDILLYETSL